jgi:ATP-dependent helicase/nuclease subunit A
LYSHEANGAAVDAAEFIGRACDPARSAVVEACAGSGKTWLLVSRMLRLLLAGAAPSQLLAITFTRKAAREMRERLMQLLHELAVQPEPEACRLLLERGVPESRLPELLPMARKLYQQALASPQGMSIDTFHGWFAKLLQASPLASDVPHAYTLAENTGELRREAYLRFMQSLDRPEQADARQALFSLYEMAGDRNARQLLDAFIDKRAEWWAACGTRRAGDASRPLAWLHALCGADALSDARLDLWGDDALIARIHDVAQLLAAGGKRSQDRADAIRQALAGDASPAGFGRLLAQFCDERGQPRGNDARHRGLQGALRDRFGPDGAEVFRDEFAAIAHELLALERRAGEPRVLALNQHLFKLGPAYLSHYQAVKAEQRMLDFGDLEWHAYRLMTSEEYAAHLQSRLDARYRHILLDEFQDTNPLQWCILRAWLDAYGGDAEPPSVFIVGDPKQSIYRFRRAEPRVFDAARDMLAQRGADVLRTGQTRRNAGAIVDVLNTVFANNPVYAPHTTLNGQSGAVWRLPLTQDDKPAAGPAAPSVPFKLHDPLTDERQEDEDTRRFNEGRAVAAAICAAMQNMARRTGHPARWSDVMVLVRKRTHLDAYENAFRIAGVPFVSDRQGGLLASLEAADLMALLDFLVMPADSLALAQVLKSPIFGASDEDLIRLARCGGDGGRYWWLRLQECAAEPICTSPALRRAAALLAEWQQAAISLPVHELLDLIVHRGELIQRYAAAAAPAMRPQVTGNIDAFVELGLRFDDRPCSSLPKFIRSLRLLQQGEDAEAPAEAAVGSVQNAVRISTIHGAKGLEAPIVALVDANHSQAPRDEAGILCRWPPHADEPTHFSFYGRSDERGAARDALFAEEERLRQQEDWNLLYVAATRASELLIVSGVAGMRGALADGCIEGSWYHRFGFVPEVDIDRAPGAVTAADCELGNAEAFSLSIFDPEPMPSASSPANKVDEPVRRTVEKS